MSWSSSEEGDLHDAVRTHEKQEDEDRFLVELKSLSVDRYLYQKDMLLENPEFGFGRFGDLIFQLNARHFDTNQKLGVKHYSYSELQQITDNFSKTDIHASLVLSQDEREPGIKSHPNVVNLIGYHCEQRLAVIYEGIRPVHFLDQLRRSDEFKWKDRMKVAIEIGSMLKMFHDKNLVHGGVWPICFMLDEKFHLMAFDFQLYSNLNSLQIYHNSPYCSAADKDKKNEGGRNWSLSDDIYTYGLLLMELITKKQPFNWGEAVLYDPPRSVVHKSLDVYEETASKVTKLAVGCLEVKKNVEEAVVDIGTVVENLESLQSIAQAEKLQSLCELLCMFVKEAEV
ncbi:hypothetical protein BUALT_Bualt04G0054900 [Buddleja alternifolia]|uniref:Protein kinase domain-containing protein n=1 Tax=Buddleja alternifolia TaxID=168488 RepID=A0AAV6XNJ2_9LAMI|nr:hypothetical protein BUALT_Bualt04G0054900 [Buddleja alternifolia]